MARFRGFVIVLVALAACTDTSGLATGEPIIDAGSQQTKDGGSSTSIDDGGGDDDGAVSPTGRCDPLKPFGPPELMTDFDPQATTTKSAVLTRDELEVFYLRYVGSGSWDLRHARRASRDAAWGAVTTDPMTPGPQGFLSVTAAGKKLYFWTIGQNYRAVRDDTATPFGPPATFYSPDNPWAFIVEGDDTAYYAKYAEGGGERIIHRSPFDSNGFSPGPQVKNIHVGGASDSRPVLNASETIMYFASNRVGGRGLDDVWVARRASKQDEFSPGVHVRELSTEDPDYVTWVSNDDCIVMLDRASHVYQAKRPL